MEESLLSWMRCSFADILSNGCDQCSEADMKEMVTALGQYIFSLSDECSLEEVIEEMAAHFGRDLTTFIETSPTFIVEACLICAVSSISADRTRFVQIIMKMEPAAQSYIMESLKNNLQHYFDPQSSNEVDEDTCSNDDDKVGTSDDSQLHNHRSDDIDRQVAPEYSSRETIHSGQRVDEDCNEQQRAKNFCFHCEENEIKRKSVEKDLQAAVRGEKEVEAKLRAEITSQTNKLIDAEIIIIQMDEKLSDKSKQLESALSNIHDNEGKISECNKIINQLQTVQDEIDILKPKADRAEASEQQLEKLRSRLDELKGVKLQLKAESAAHTETHTKLLESEQELDSLRKAKIQVDEYRGQCAESAIQIEELASRLRQRDQEIQRLEEDCHHLRGGQQGQRLEAQHLSDELKAANEQLRNDRLGGDGVGEGMSELNPALMNELNKLRTENSDLLRKIDASSMDALDLLESQIKDLKCINSSLQEKWMTAKDSLAHTLNIVASLNGQLTVLKDEYSYFQLLTCENKGMAQEELQSLRYSKELELTNVATTFEANISHLKRNHEAEITSVTNKLLETEDILRSKIATLAQVKHEKESVIVDLSFLEQELLEEKVLRSGDQEAAKIAKEEFLTSKKTEIEAIQEEGQDRMQLLIDHHEVNLATEIERARDAAAELDGERLKRRRADREKKFFEAETHRLKTLLTVSTGGGSSGQDIEEALKEMKSMQVLLDDANSEIQVLRSQGGSDVTTRLRSKDHTRGTESEVQGPAGTGVRGGAVRPQRSKGGDVSSLGSSVTHSGNVGQMGGTYGGYLEQAEVIDKRVDQLTREKRDLLSKNLEENKERLEISQKLILSEREVRNLKAKVTKMTLEKERAERRAANMAVSDDVGSSESPPKKSTACMKRGRRAEADMLLNEI